MQKIIGLIRESQELTVRDVLPYLSDSMTIDAFKDEICECLDKYEGLLAGTVERLLGSSCGVSGASFMGTSLFCITEEAHK